ncbi:MAG TPA: hypothetical protein VNR20_06565 [Terriglobales bacterium]|nr:hypothetical protein [Terriglobales bacterium]
MQRTPKDVLFYTMAGLLAKRSQQQRYAVKVEALRCVEMKTSWRSWLTA